MTTITLPRAVVEQALKTLESDTDGAMYSVRCEEAITALRAALAQQAHTDDLNQRIKLYVGSRCAPPQQAEPVTRGAAYGDALRWAIKACGAVQRDDGVWFGDDAAARLARVLSEGASPPQQAEQAEPAEPAAKVELMMTGGNAGLATRIVEIDDHLRERLRPGQLLYTTPPPRKPLTEEEIPALAEKAWTPSVYHDAEALLGTDGLVALVRAVEAKHNIKE